MGKTIKTFGIVGLVALVLVIAGCNSMGTAYNTDGSIAEKIPQDVGVARAVAEAIKNCPAVNPALFKPAQFTRDCSAETTAAGSAECYRAMQTNSTNNVIGRLVSTLKTTESCQSAAAKVGVEYMRKEMVQAKEIRRGSTSGILGLTSYGISKELVTGFVAGTAAGDTRIGSVNVSGSSNGGAAGEGTGGRGTTTMDTNIGAGNSINTLSGDAQINRAEKQVLAPVTGGGDSAPVLDDSGDGSGNQAGINPFGQ